MSEEPAGTGLPAPEQDAPHVTGRKRKPSTFAERLKKAKERNKTLSVTRTRRVPIRLGVTLEVYEVLLRFAEQNGNQTVQSIAHECMLDGLSRYAALRTSRLRKNAFEGDTFGLSARRPDITDASETYGGPNEKRVQEEIGERIKSVPGLRSFANANRR